MASRCEFWAETDSFVTLSPIIRRCVGVAGRRDRPSRLVIRYVLSPASAGEFAWLWSRRSRVQVPSLTPHRSPAFAGLFRWWGLGRPGGRRTRFRHECLYSGGLCRITVDCAR